MGKYTTTVYNCDKCNKRITYSSCLDIMTSLTEAVCWSRLHVRIIRIHGIHNDANYDKAFLCKKCTMMLLKDALERVEKGERTTKGTEEIDEQGWDT
jgi:hypothetical protein